MKSWLLAALLLLPGLSGCKKVGERVVHRASAKLDEQLADLRGPCEATIKRRLEGLSPPGTFGRLQQQSFSLSYDNGSKSGEVSGKVEFVRSGQQRHSKYTCTLAGDKVNVDFSPSDSVPAKAH